MEGGNEGGRGREGGGGEGGREGCMLYILNGAR